MLMTAKNPRQHKWNQGRSRCTQRPPGARTPCLVSSSAAPQLWQPVTIILKQFKHYILGGFFTKLGQQGDGHNKNHATSSRGKQTLSATCTRACHQVQVHCTVLISTNQEDSTSSVQHTLHYSDALVRSFALDEAKWRLSMEDHAILGQGKLEIKQEHSGDGDAQVDI